MHISLRISPLESTHDLCGDEHFCYGIFHRCIWVDKDFVLRTTLFSGLCCFDKLAFITNQFMKIQYSLIKVKDIGIYLLKLTMI